MRKVVFYIVFLGFGVYISSAFSEETKEMLTISGQERLRGDFARNQSLRDFSLTPGTHDGQLISRTRAAVSVKPIKPLEVFAQGQFYLRENNYDYSKMNIYQAYIDFSDREHLPIGLKIGRQELCYGSTFFLGPNDFYDGLVWDAAKLSVYPAEKIWLDLIAARYVKLNKHRSDSKPALYGGYGSYELSEAANIDLYLFYHHGGFEFFHTDLVYSPRWFTAGTRLAGKFRGFDYEIEPLYQFGKIDNPDRDKRDNIGAYGGHVDIGYTFKTMFNPRVFAAYAAGSGDNKTSDKWYREFHGNIYNDNYLVGDTSLIPDLSGITSGGARASGMHAFVAGLSLDILPKLNLNIDNHYFLAGKTPEGTSRDVGDEINLIATYRVFDNLSIVASINRFFTGNFFKDASGSGKDITYFYIQTQIEF